MELASGMSARFRAASMTMHCRPRHRPSSGILFSRAYWIAPTLPETPRSPKPPGMQIASTSPSCLAAPAGVLQSSEVTHLILTRALLANPCGAQRLGDREVGVGQVDVLADERHGDLVDRVVDAVEQVVPGRPVHVAERQVQLADDVGVEALGVQDLRDVVDRLGVDRRHHGGLVDVAHQRDLALDGGGDLAVGPKDDRVRLDTDVAQRRDRVLRRLGLQLARRADVRQERDVHDEDVVAADLVTDLADRLQERQRLDVTDRAADLGDDDVDVVGRHPADAVLDLVGDVRDDLHGVTEVLAAPLLGDDGGVHLAGGHIGRTVQVHVEEALVVPDVQVGLGAVVGDEHLAVLERVHGARVDVQVRVELLHRDPQTPRLEQRAQAGGRQSLAEGGGDTPGDEDVLGRRGCAVSKSTGRHGQEGAPVVAVWGACRLRDPEISGGAVAAVRGFLAHRSTGYQGISDRTRLLPATLRAHLGTHPAHRSLDRLSRVARSSTRIFHVRRILLGHSLPSLSGTRHHPVRIRNKEGLSVRFETTIASPIATDN